MFRVTVCINCGSYSEKIHFLRVRIAEQHMSRDKMAIVNVALYLNRSVVFGWQILKTFTPTDK